MDKALNEQQIMREAINTDGVQLLFQKLQAVSDSMERKQLALDPFTQAAEIKRSQEFRYVVNEFFPHIIEGLINYDAEAPDKQVPPRKRWKFITWLHALTGQK